MSAKRVPHTNVQAEQVLLGAILSPLVTMFHEACSILKAEHFADPVHGFIYRQIAQRVEAGFQEWELRDEVETNRAPPDIDAGLEEVGGERYLLQLVQLYEANRQGFNPSSYAESIAYCWTARRAYDLADMLNAHVSTILGWIGRPDDLLHQDHIAAMEQAVGALTDAGVQIEDGIQTVDGHLVDMRHPDASADRFDMAGEPMLVTVALDREQAWVLNQHHLRQQAMYAAMGRSEVCGYHMRRAFPLATALHAVDDELRRQDRADMEAFFGQADAQDDGKIPGPGFMP